LSGQTGATRVAHRSAQSDFQESIMIISTETAGNLSTTNASWTPIPGLVLRIPEIVGQTVLFILDVPNPYANGKDFPGGNFGIAFDGQIQPIFAAFTYSLQNPVAPGRMPTTLCVPVKLAGKLIATAMWSSIRNSTVHIDSPATLTMIL
jgi:mannose-binding lectin